MSYQIQIFRSLKPEDDGIQSVANEWLKKQPKNFKIISISAESSVSRPGDGRIQEGIWHTLYIVYTTD